MNMIPFVLKATTITLFPAGQAPVIIDSAHPNFTAVREELVAGNYEEALNLASVTQFFATLSAGKVAIVNDEVLYDGAPITGYLAGKMIDFVREGLPVEHYMLFLNNLMANPSMTSRNELFLFLEAANLPITEDGHFLAYKAVRSDFRDKHSGRFDNTPGVTHTMPRRDVDDDRNRTCSYGFHAAAYDYAKSFMGGEGRMVAVKINPADVVSVPSDYNNQKLRACKYTVVFEIPNAADTLTGRPYYNTAAQPVFDPEENSYFWGDIWNDDDAQDDDDQF